MIVLDPTEKLNQIYVREIRRIILVIIIRRLFPHQYYGITVRYRSGTC